jgi:hypothetical protein
MGLGPRATYPAIAVSLLALLSAAPAAAATVTVTDIKAGEGYEVVVPTVEAVDTNLTEAQIRGLFTGDFAKEAGALSQLDAASVKIPEIRVSYDVPTTTGTTERAVVVYHDLELTNVVDGVAASAVVRSTTIEGSGQMEMTFGKMSTSTFDIGGLLSFYGLGQAGDAGVFKTLYADFNFEGATISGPGFACDIGGATLADFRARPLTTDFNEITTLLAAADPQKAPMPEQMGKIIDFYVDILTAFESSPMAMEGFSCTGKSDKGNPVAVTSGGLDVGGWAPGTYPAISVNATRVDVENEGWISLGNFTFKKMDFNAALAVLKASKAELSEAWFEANWRKVIPALDGLSFSDFAMDIPDPENAEARLQGGVGSFDISLADYVNGIPTNIGLSAGHVAFTVPNEGEGRELREAGIDKLDLGFDFAADWDEAAKTIALSKFSLTGVDMGTVSISGTLGNATPELFSADTNVAMLAAMGLSIKDVTLDIDDEGLSTLLIGMIAAEEKQDPNVMRAGFSGMARAMAMGLLGATPASMETGAQIGAFLDGKPKLVVRIVANDPGGISLPELMAAEKDPTILTSKVTVTAEASGEPRDVFVPAPAPEPTPAPTEAPVVGDDVQSPAQQEKSTLKN